ncbi:MAG: FAD-dependent oxidoreductase [Thermodesulfobacteriota bacterium]|nr:FAD-dependent oxidoreductase [Thermodesulfobacteriota bacterium]
METKVDSLIIGAGLSGLSAGVRLSQFQDKVVILESHNISGGLSSYYIRKTKNEQMLFNSGLHTVTNYKVQNRKWGIGLICRNLGITREELNLYPAKYPSRIKSASGQLFFSNDESTLEDSILSLSKDSIDDFIAFVKFTQQKGKEFEWANLNCWDVLHSQFRSKRIIDLLSIPVFYYAGYKKEFIDFLTYSIIFRSIYLDGCCSPDSIKNVLFLLMKKFGSNGGVIKFNTKIEKLIAFKDKIVEVITSDGDTIVADAILSSVGINETKELLSENSSEISNISLFETVICYDNSILETGIKNTLSFNYDRESFVWNMPRLHERSPYYSMSFLYNYSFPKDPPLQIKICTFQSGDDWNNLAEDDYILTKDKYTSYLKNYLYNEYPSLIEANQIYTDSFSPKTINRFTSHINGAIYGSKAKSFSGKTGYSNLFIIGNDQGGIGIMGALISGIIVSNYNVIL